MATSAELLIQRRDAICAELAALSSSTAGGKPNSSGGGDMVHVDHQGYKRSLYEPVHGSPSSRRARRQPPQNASGTASSSHRL